MKVYVLMDMEKNEGGSVEKVFRTRKKAEIYAKKVPPIDFWKIVEKEVE